jgi:hypothetical protein
MGNVFRVINSNGDIEITMYRKANAVFKTNEYNETDNICTYKETINIFNLLQENYELKSQLNTIIKYIKSIDYDYLDESNQHNVVEYLDSILNRIGDDK